MNLNLLLVAREDGKFFDNFGEPLLDSLVAILGVFLVLVIIILCVNVLGLIKFKSETKEESIPSPATPSNDGYHAVDENDSDMMAAVLVASIDFYDETKQAPQVMGVKEIK